MDTLPDSLILHILNFVFPRDLVTISEVSKRFHRIAQDDILWRSMFHKHFDVKPVHLRPFDKPTWKEEFIRIVEDTPVFESEVIHRHSDQVLYVAYSHNGKRFVTCGKDAYINIWKNGYPVRLEYSRHMDDFHWKYTQYAEFNKLDTLLLVSGVLEGNSSTLGEIAIFSVEDEFFMKCRVRSNPYDIFGTWYSDQFFFSGQLRWLGNLVSASTIWLNRASQEAHSEHTQIIEQKFNFYNPCASSIRSLMVADCIEVPGEEDTSAQLSKKRSLGTSFSVKENESEPDKRLKRDGNESLSKTGQEAYTSPSNSAEDPKMSFESSSSTCTSPVGNVVDPQTKWLIFTCGSETYTSHQLGFKKISPFCFTERIETNLSIRERRQLLRMAREAEEEEPPIEFMDYPAVSHMFDQIDHVLNLHGHIIGMALSPDGRYLYVNSRPWPEDYEILDPLDPPQIAQEIDIHIVDLSTVQQIGTLKRAHKAYTSNRDCFFIFLNISDLYVASGAEDKHAYVWDRNYGITLVKLPHDDVCNSVAFNPVDQRTLVSVSDDNSIKIWRSKSLCKELGLDHNDYRKGQLLYLDAASMS